MSEWFDIDRIAPCLKCGNDLTTVMEGEMMPWGGTVFTSHGNYGSTVFDSVGGREHLMVTICDGCLRTVAELRPGVIRLVKPAYVPKPPASVTAWQAPESEEDD